MPLFLDACALAKRYLPEQLSSRRMRDIASRFDLWGGFVVSSFIEPEVISAFARYAREHPNYSRELMARHGRVVELFRKDLSNASFTILSIDDEVVEEAAGMLKRHPEYAIHSGDAVHLVTALRAREELGDGQTLVFVTADRGLEQAARAEGFPTLNPMHEGIDELRRMMSEPPNVRDADRLA